MQQEPFQHIFGGREKEPGFLKEVTERYPYFGAAQYMLLKNTDKNDPAYETIAAKAGVFFDGPFIPEMLLQKEGRVTQIPTPAEPAANETGKPVEIIREVAQPPISPITKAESTELPSEKPLFEPLHATDYFASQGIKLSEEALGGDKLGQQLKSFTAWLKTMKKVHPDKMGGGAATETVIQHLAEKSNIEAEVVTEAMAEAYIQQGKHAQAIEIWSKLSLQNPSKSAYFAAKIDSLKY